MAEPFPRVRAAAIDGRAHNVFYRQIQLERLCQATISNIDGLCDAIATDNGHNSSEIAVEINLTVSAIRRDYATLDSKQALSEEYLIANGQDVPVGAKPVGIVYIEPCRHTLLYSVVVPLSAAIAAGNCVIVLLENNLRAVAALLRQVLLDALDPDTFAIASSPINDENLLCSLVHINQNNSEQWPRANQRFSHAQSRTLAIVDRTADAKSAARELVAACFSFGGRSPYAPDVVLVNEFTRQSFLQAVIAESVAVGSASISKGDAKHRSTDSPGVSEQIEALRKADPELRVIVQERNFAVVEASSRRSDFFTQKINAPVMVVHTIRSLDDAIDLVSNTSNGTPALAAYHFSNPASAKYLTQFVDARVSLVNSIPRELLVGPAFPAAHPIDISARYPLHLFTEQNPAYIKPAANSQALSAALASSDNDSARTLMAQAKAPLAAVKRHPGGGVGFFEQGFLLNAALILTTTISVTGSAIYWGLKYRRSM
ncbi:hypothetical protein LTR17_024479 [Elasticomyces elasticus]|nr:hypothetical protein LTR17_024479 [Elasticomyces elasticus]